MFRRTRTLLLITALACAGNDVSVRDETTETSPPAVTAATAPEPSSPALKRYRIQPADLPVAYDTPDANNPPRVVPRPQGAELILPPRFHIAPFAEGGFELPRGLKLAPNGDVFVTDPEAGKVVVLRDADGDGTAEQRFTFAADLMQPFGLAIGHGYLYVGNTNGVVRFRYQPGQTAASSPPESVAALPGMGYREHWTRNLVFSPDGRKLYATVGSESNVSVEKEPMRAAIIEFNPDGTGKRLFATGLRNPVGVAFYPGTNTLWAGVQERDRLGDDLPPDYVTSVQDGGFYGWPFAYAGKNEDPRRKGERPDLVARTIIPDVLIQAHSSVLGLMFYTGNMFPEDYRGDAFVALHGSWNRSKRTGYKIIRIPFEKGRPVGGYEDFVVGWMADESQREVWGRPVDLLVLRDGSMLISDDGAKMIWRVSYR
jgi:glucose/arabinose dehydrogenase